MQSSDQKPNEPADRVDNWVDLLEQRVADDPDRTAFTFWADGANPAESVTYQEFHRRVLASAARLQSLGAAGQRVLLLNAPNIQYIQAFFACLYAAAIPAPGFPPRANRMGARIDAIARDCDARFAIADAATWRRLDDSEVALTAVRQRIALDESDLAFGPADWTRPRVGSDDIAFLQYTSGSTSTPKGVEVRHGNLLHNARVIAASFGGGPETNAVSWLPPYHDMGLIGMILQPLYLGCTLTFMPPLAFLQRPIRWLEAISRLRCRISGGPNFAYEHCVRRTTPDQRAGLDLSHWEVAFCGAEPIRAETVQRFAEAFAPCGFRPEAFHPCYGLAEATLMVTGKRRLQPHRTMAVSATRLDAHQVTPISRSGENGTAARKLVGCGAPLLDNEVAIVEVADDGARTCGPLEIGEIWVRGPSVARGYYGRSEATAETFGRHLANGSGPYLATGDLGFLDEHGELYVTGRADDLLIFAGRNVYPQDIERTVQSADPALIIDGGAAFSVEGDGGTELVIVQEWRSKSDADPNASLSRIRQAVSEQHELEPATVLLLRRGRTPKTSSGKVQRKLARRMFVDAEFEPLARWDRPAATGPSRLEASGSPLTERELRMWLQERIAVRAGVSAESIDPHAPLTCLGLDSRGAVELAAALEDRLGRSVPATLAFEHPTIVELTRHLVGERPRGAAVGRGRRKPRQTADEPIAVVGLACRFPQAPDREAYWRLLIEGRDAVAPPSDARRQRPHAGLATAAFLEAVDGFDAAFFGISPREAERMDPQQRLLLTLVWEALEDAGIPVDTLRGSDTGVFVGISNQDYTHLRDGVAADCDAHINTGNAHSVAANRVSYFLDLQGPSWAVDTACSSSLTAVHQACESLRRGEATQAVAAGVNLLLSEHVTANLRQGGFLSADGRSKAFSAAADGYGRGEGAAAIWLKPLSQAQVDGDHIRAVLLGSAVVQDGRSNGLTAPNGAAQQRVIEAALAQADIPAAAVDYVETHGTGTILGDAIEARALGEFFARGATDRPLRIGSAKSNIAHLEAAAGLAGLIKVVLAAEQRQLPASLHCDPPNEHLDWDALGLAVVREPQPLSGDRWIAGVSSFGFGGTNVHVVVASAEPPVPSRRAEGGLPLLPVSAHDSQALSPLLRSHADQLERQLEIPWSLHAAATARNRSSLAFRAAVVADSREEGIAALRSAAEAQPPPRALETPRLAWVFSGQGGHWPGMGRGLLESFPTAAASVARFDAALAVWGTPPVEPLLRSGDPEAWEDPGRLQPAVAALQIALAELWRHWGVEPDVIVGHSLGEVAAAWTAGALSLRDAAGVASQRGILMRRVAGQGRSLAVGLSPEQAAEFVADHPDVSVAVVNGPAACVLSGGISAIETVRAELTRREIFCKPLPGDLPFHCALMDPLRPELVAKLAEIQPAAPQIPWWSSVSATPLEGPAADARYWGANLREPVRFAATMAPLFAEGIDAVLEIGPHPVLRTPLRQLAEQAGRTPPIVGCLRRDTAARRSLAEAAALLWTSGAGLDWNGVFPGPRPQVALPTYPWQAESYWLGGPDTATEWATGGSWSADAHPLLGVALDAPPQWPTARLWRATNPPWRQAGLLSEQGRLAADAGLRLARAAATEVAGPGGFEIADLRVEPDLPADCPRYQVGLIPADAGLEFAVHAEDGPGRWIICVRARIEPLSAESRATT